MDSIQTIIDKAGKTLSGVAGIKAAVLGGSRARGTHTAGSDVDIGIYYEENALDLAALDKAAQAMDDERRKNLITPPGGWGRWVNGGAWLRVDGYPVDFILRDFARVKQVVLACQNGNISIHYQTGHPHGFLSAMYMGELAVCKLLWEADGDVSGLKQTAEQYPQKLKEAILRLFSFEAGFSLALAEKNAGKDDRYYVTAHLVRSVSALNQVLFALNETYCLNEKKAARMIDAFAIQPPDYNARVSAVFSEAQEAKACASLKSLVDEVDALLRGSQ